MVRAHPSSKLKLQDIARLIFDLRGRPKAAIESTSHTTPILGVRVPEARFAVSARGILGGWAATRAANESRLTVDAHLQNSSLVAQQELAAPSRLLGVVALSTHPPRPSRRNSRPEHNARFRAPRSQAWGRRSNCPGNPPTPSHNGRRASQMGMPTSWPAKPWLKLIFRRPIQIRPCRLICSRDGKAETRARSGVVRGDPQASTMGRNDQTAHRQTQSEAFILGRKK